MTTRRQLLQGLAAVGLLGQHGGADRVLQVRLHPGDHRRKARVAHAAAIWLQHNPALAERACRFDVIGIEGAGERPRISWIKNAFTA